MCRLVFLTVLFLLVSVSARAQLAASYTDCSALNGATFNVSGVGPPSPPFTRTNAATIASLLDTDLVEIQVTATGTTGLAQIEVDVSGATALTAALNPGGSSSGTFDPTADIANVVLQFTNRFSGTPGLEMGLTFSVSCTPNTGAATARSFLNERNRRMLDVRPDRPRMVRKQLSSLWGDVTLDQNNGNVGQTFTNFWAGENRVRAHLNLGGLVGRRSEEGRSVLNSGYDAANSEIQRAGCWDVWTEAHYTRISDSGSRSGDFLVGYAGIDCQIHPAAILGFLGQVDWMNDEIGSVTAKTKGTGWMVGPYATARLTSNLFFDFRAAWGRSNNDVDVAGVTGSFDTTRWLVDGQLTGNMQIGDVRITPELSLSYIEERQESYMDSSNTAIPSQIVSLGRVRFGPEFSQRHVLDSGLIVEPHFAIRGIWDFAGTNVTIAGVDYNIEGLRAAVELGAIVQHSDNFNLRITAKYDGVGLNDYGALGGQIWLNIPLN